jgi:hypothetical protein
MAMNLSRRRLRRSNSELRQADIAALPINKIIGCRVDNGPGVGFKPPMSLTDMDDEDDLEDFFMDME